MFYSKASFTNNVFILTNQFSFYFEKSLISEHLLRYYAPDVITSRTNCPYLSLLCGSASKNGKRGCEDLAALCKPE